MDIHIYKYMYIYICIYICPNGHKLACLEADDEPTIICTAFGSFASRCPEKLKTPCSLKPAKYGNIALTRVAQGKHPDVSNKSRLTSIVPFEYDPGLEAHLADLASAKRSHRPKPSDLCTRLAGSESSSAGLVCLAGSENHTSTTSDNTVQSNVGNGSNTSGSTRLTELMTRVRAKENRSKTLMR